VTSPVRNRRLKSLEGMNPDPGYFGPIHFDLTAFGPRDGATRRIYFTAVDEGARAVFGWAEVPATWRLPRLRQHLKGRAWTYIDLSTDKLIWRLAYLDGFKASQKLREAAEAARAEKP
jgi:hypothetical protein